MVKGGLFIIMKLIQVQIVNAMCINFKVHLINAYSFKFQGNFWMCIKYIEQFLTD